MNHALTRSMVIPEIVKLIAAKYHLTEMEALDKFYTSATGLTTGFRMCLTSLKFQCEILSMHCLGVQTVCLLRINSEIEATTVWEYKRSAC